MSELLVELQTEELPPKALEKLSIAFAKGVFESLKKQNFLTEDAVLTPFASPRRLALKISHVLPISPDEAFTQKLVPVRIGLDAEGKATPALIKKMNALGLACEVHELKRVVDGKNEQLVFEGIKAGEALVNGLQKALEVSIAALPIPKVMTYQLNDGVTTVEFVRPVKYLVALLDAEIIPVKLFGLTAGRITRGHRFHTTELIEIPNAQAYEGVMQEGKIQPNFVARRELMVRMLKQHAQALQAEVIMPDDLVNEVASLTEWPVVYESEFEKEFLEVPEECLILTMQLNQKYFALRDQNARLMNKFLLVSQIEAKDGGQAISSGNARVVRARLADAKFFYDQDRLSTLESRVEGLKHVVYHNKLGSQAERMQRVKAMAEKFAALLGANVGHAGRAAMLAKADLRTLMVGEFPELQGIMGEYYAKHDGEDAAVSLAIREHYQPRYAGDALPSNLESLSVALADKMETLVGLFGIGQVPTGDKDPFALRRHALGVLRMLIEKRLPLSLTTLIDAAWNVESTLNNVKDPREAIKAFFIDRLRVMLRDLGYSAQEVDAVLSLELNQLADVTERLQAIRTFMTLPEAEALTAANKRIGNILKKIEGVVPTEIYADRLVEEAEKALYSRLQTVKPNALSLYEEGKYEAMLLELAPLRDVVDAFFESVMVNAEDLDLRANRQALLADLYDVMNRVAQIARLAK